MSESETRIALLRRVDGLFKLVIERREDGPTPVYEEHLQPLRQPGNTPGELELLAAWDLLSAVREIEPPVLEAVRAILVATVIDPEGERPTLQPLEIAPPPPAHKPTAANPRAYQGTKDRPPKPKRPAVRDLRPHLCVIGGQDRLVQLLTKELGSVDLPGEQRDAPPGYRRGFAWLALIHPQNLAGALGVHHELDLERDEPARRAAAVFASTFDKHTMAWLRVAADIRPDQRVRFFELVSETGAKRRDPEPVRDVLGQIAAACSSDNFETRMRYALSVAANDDDVTAASWAFELADLHAPNLNFQRLDDDHDYLAPIGHEPFRKFQEYVDAHFPDSEWDVLHIWGACCIDDALPDELANITAAGLDPPAARRLGIDLASGVTYDDPDLASWSEHRDALRAFVAAVRDVPFQLKAIWQMHELLWEACLERLPLTTRLLPVICNKPLSKETEIAKPLGRFGAVTPANQERLLAADVRCYQVLDDESRRDNDAWLISCGLDSFVRHGEGLFTDAFVDHPRTLCRTARTLGLLSKPQRHEIVRQVIGSPLGLDPCSMSPASLVEMLDRHGSQSGTSHVPKKLREHLNGTTRLTEAQVRRAAAVIIKSWPAIMCERIQELAIAKMAASLDEGDLDLTELNAQMLHALKLQAGIDRNQRGIRRLLRACYQGDETYLQQHPRNQEWLSSHTAFASRWLEGFTITRDVPGHGIVTVSIEHDPLEALRLGTYVGSCLGLGGNFSWSAAGTALDINKQVAFARDANGHFLARQVLGITNEDRLACYHVYPESSDSMQQVFREFDSLYAAHLDLELATDDDDDAGIRLLVAADWWDDGIWSEDDNDRSDDCK